MGIFGSVSRGTQTDKSDVDLIFGYCTGTRVFAEADASVIDMEDPLKEALGRKVDMFFFVEGGNMRLAELRALLTCKTIWGDPNFYERTRKKAIEQLRETHSRINDIVTVGKAIVPQLSSVLTRCDTLWLAMLFRG